MLRRRTKQVVLAEVLLIASMSSVALRTHFGSGPDTGSLPGVLLVVLVVGLPSLAVVGGTSGWRIWPIECALSAPWIPIGLVGDFSETDGGFVFLVPALLALVQVGLVVLAVVVPALRRRRPSGTDRR